MTLLHPVNARLRCVEPLPQRRLGVRAGHTANGVRGAVDEVTPHPTSVRRSRGCHLDGVAVVLGLPLLLAVFCHLLMVSTSKGIGA